jgi:hypothetical protein
MKRILCTLAALLVLAATALPAAASCTTHTYFIDGRVVICSTCCYGNQCYTNCF